MVILPEQGWSRKGDELSGPIQGGDLSLSNGYRGKLLNVYQWSDLSTFWSILIHPCMNILVGAGVCRAGGYASFEL